MARSGDDRFEQRLDRWVEAGRQFVDGVSGARPGSRNATRRGAARLNPGELGRWVENKLEWLLDEEPDDDWREPWQQPRLRAQPRDAQARDPQLRDAQLRDPQPREIQPRSATPKRRLEAMSRRPPRALDDAASAPGLAPEAAAASDQHLQDWPSDELFTVPRWQRQQPAGRQPLPQSSEPVMERPARNQDGRPLPRSSRRR